MDIDFELETQHLFLIERTCVVCGKQKNLIADFYKCRPDATKISSYAYECKECTVKRVCENNRRNRLKKNRIKKMKQTENLQQLMERFTKRLKQVNPDDKERVSYLKGCIDTVDYLATGKLPNDGNHDGMKNHRPRHSDLDALDLSLIHI